MKKISSIIFCLVLSSVCIGQVIDNFTDGDFTNSPTWSGSTPQFIVNAAKQLQLSNSVAATSYLSTPFSAASLDNFEWQFYVRQSFAPSGSNNGRVYLASDQADLTQPLNGYFLQFGEAGSLDAIQLFKQTGTALTSVCRGTNSAIASAFALRVKVTRDNTGLWSLYVDYTGGKSFTLDASNTDASINSSSFFGVRCLYTVTNATKFYYDDFYAGTKQVPIDLTKPTVAGIQTSTSNSISVLFSEAVDQTTAETISNYSSTNSVGNPSTVTLQADGKTAALSFAASFGNGIKNQLTISGVKDIAGNAMRDTTAVFLFFQPTPAKVKDIIISEIFADPSPQVGLPTEEYIEIYNRSVNPFDLAGWKLSDGVSTATLGSQIILPNQYWIVCSSSNTNLFSGNVIGVSAFPSLNNDGDALTFRDASGKTIDSVNYDQSWYHDTNRQEGGWSLEIIDVNNICGEGENWAVSENASGGTPGKQNSVFANKPDLTGPQLLSATPVSSTKLNLAFNEKLEKDISTVSFELTPNVSISKKYFTDASLRQISIELSNELALRELYAIKVGNLTDCSGNFIQREFDQLSFALPEAADSLDVIVNEILFNPRTGGVDFVEVYNKSAKYINLKNWKLGNYGSASAPAAITAIDFILTPSSYLVFTSDPTVLSTQYSQSNKNVLVKASLPSLPDDKGSVALINDKGMLIDHFNYSERMHSPFVKNNEGVSLERISFSEKTNEVSNWKSANASAGFATPGFINSNSRPQSAINENAVVVEPEIFSPSVPGKDFAKINFKFDHSGMAANVKIFDQQGRLIKTLANNETLQYEGSFRWDGDRDDGTHSRVGYYVVWFEVTDQNGSVTVFRKRAVIGK